MTKLSDAQRQALEKLSVGALKRGLFSGWGPLHHGSGAHRIEVHEATADKLISLGLAEPFLINGDPKSATLYITEAGRRALAAKPH